MNKVLSKRILRDLKENFMRYLALIVMIILCMYIIVSVVAAADTIIDGSTAAAEKNMVRVIDLLAHFRTVFQKCVV